MDYQFKSEKSIFLLPKVDIQLWNFVYDFWGVGGDVWRQNNSNHVNIGAIDLVKHTQAGSKEPHQRQQNFLLVLKIVKGGFSQGGSEIILITQSSPNYYTSTLRKIHP